MKADYRDNYERIAHDHVAHWRETGENPWQSDEHVAAVQDGVLDALARYTDPGASVLDAGCGMGNLMARITDRQVIGLDFAAEYVALGRERGLDIVQGELEAIPYPDGRFDAVIATDVLEHVLDLNRVVAELLRVLKPGAVLIVQSPEAEDIAIYLTDQNPYRYVHLRRFDEATFRLLFTRIFDAEVLETAVIDGERMVVVRR